MKLYIETSVPNMLLHGDAPDKQRITELFLEWLRLSEHEPFISPVVMREIARARSPRRERLERAVVAFGATMLPLTDEAMLLAGDYEAARIVPAKFQDDLLHVAVAVCHRLDMVVTWNMEHLANLNKVARINATNRRQGWPLIRIHTPQEVLGL
jgi:predicted nucleic acid-binding protein